MQERKKTLRLGFLLGQELAEELRRLWVFVQKPSTNGAFPISFGSFFNLFNQLAELVLELRGQANSYRKFNVAGLVIEDLSLTTSRVFEGWNIKTWLHDQPQCAEIRAIARARRRKCKFISAIVVCGPPQYDERSGITAPTLHPCGYCRETLRQLLREGVICRSTMIITLHPKERIFEVQTVEQLLKLHGHI